MKKLNVVVAFLAGIVVSGLVLFAGLAPRLASDEAPARTKSVSAFGFEEMSGPTGAAAPAAPMEEGALGKLGYRGGGSAGEGLEGKNLPVLSQQPAPEPEKAPRPSGDLEGTEQGAPTRAWFPETFLFEPVVATDAHGRATVPVRVPDRLTSWRVLALAHSREGAQAGTVARFAGTLPLYVDAVVPPFLTAGDEVRLPIQLVNTTGGEITRGLRFEAAGAVLSVVGGAVRVPAEASDVRYVSLKVERPGQATVKAILEGADAVERTIEVRPAGRPATVSKGGTLAAPRAFTLAGPADPLPDTERARLLVFPGALALLRSELSSALHRAGVAEDAYSLLLAGRAPELLRALGDEPDPQALRALTLVATQRAIHHGRAPSVAEAAVLTEAALSHPENPVLSRLGERLAATLAASQRPDGTFQGEDRWTLQRLMVATADCLRALRAAQGTAVAKQRAAGATLRAAGAFERNLERIEDGYTAAAVLSSGAVSGTLAERLRTRVKESIKQSDDGAAYLSVEPGVVRADGRSPSVAEATALAALALADDAASAGAVADLGTTLLGGYDPSHGWGDGQANLLCLRAVTRLFREPVPANVRVVLERDGQRVAEGTLDASRLKEVLTLEASALGSAGEHQWTVRAEPAVPGLGFSLTVGAFVPWKQEPPNGGLELAIEIPKDAQVGRRAEVGLTATAPSGMGLRIRHALPAGVQPEKASLEALVESGAVSRYETEDGAVVLDVPSREVNQPFVARYTVVPTLAGTLHGSASVLAPAGRPELARYVAPARWTVRP